MVNEYELYYLHIFPNESIVLLNFSQEKMKYFLPLPEVFTDNRPLMSFFFPEKRLTSPDY